MANPKKGFTFLELMVTVSILSIGIVGVYKVLLGSLDYQRELSCRLYGANLIEHEISFLENQYKAAGEFPAEENGKVVEVVLDRRNVSFQFAITNVISQNNIVGLIPVEIILSWTDRGRTISLKRAIYLANLNIKPSADAASSPSL